MEASPDDKIWGIGFNSEDAEGREAEWGNDGLGKALMRVRERLRKEKVERRCTGTWSQIVHTCNTRAVWKKVTSVRHVN